MALDIDYVRRRIDLDEPDYGALAAALGEEAVPHLLELIEDEDPAVASKATYLLSLLPTPESVAGLEIAAQSADANVRVAAAAGLANVTEAGAEDVLRRLLADSDAGVRKVALESARRIPSGSFRAEVERIASADPEERLRSTARDVLRELS